MKSFQSSIVAFLFLMSIAFAAFGEGPQAGADAFKAGRGGQGATCTSTNGQSTCTCGAKCQATAIACQCYGIPPSTKNRPQATGPTSLLGNTNESKAVCTSGNGKKVCNCGDKGCDATLIGCSCLSN